MTKPFEQRVGRTISYIPKSEDFIQVAYFMDDDEMEHYVYKRIIQTEEPHTELKQKENSLEGRC